MYQPLFLKYRPQTFSQLVGQGPIVTTLSNALKTQRLAHAYLFTGSRGTGKTSTARILAKAINCETGMTPDPCGMCSMCVGITQGNALDVIEIDAASNTGVDNIRDLIERAQLSPAQARYKVYVIDECHMLSSAAFNALLKTLEEPPPRVIFILATTDPQRVLPTIISRCQRFDFKRIDLEAMTQHLAHIAQLETISITPEALELVAQIAQGGLRDAESLLDQLGLLEGTVAVDHVWNLVGAVPEQDLLGLLNAIQERDVTGILGICRRLISSGREPMQVLQDLTGFLRDALLAKVAPDQRAWVALTRPTWEQLVQLAPQLTQPWLLHLQSTLRGAEPLIRHSTQPRMWLEVTLLELIQEPARSTTIGTSVPDVIPKPVTAPRVPPELSPPVPVTEVRHDPPVPPPLVVVPAPSPPVLIPETTIRAVSSTGLGARWDEFLHILRTAPPKGLINPSTKGILTNGFVLRETDRDIVIGFKSKFFIEKLRDPKPRKEVLEVVEWFLGQYKNIGFEVAQGPPTVALAPVQPTVKAVAPPVATPPQSIAPPPAPSVDPPMRPMPTPVAVAQPMPVDDVLMSASKSLAHMFNGTVITDNTSGSVDPTEEEDDF